MLTLRNASVCPPPTSFNGTAMQPELKSYDVCAPLHSLPVYMRSKLLAQSIVKQSVNVTLRGRNGSTLLDQFSPATAEISVAEQFAVGVLVAASSSVNATVSQVGHGPASTVTS